VIKIQTKVKAADAREIIEWTLQFARNSCSDFEPTEEQLNQAADYCVEGQDAWEAAAAIQEGRRLRRRKDK
jgi:hypothetical protein